MHPDQHREPSASTTARLDNYSVIVERHQSLVWAIAFAATGDAAASDDIVQETFLAAWKQQADIRDLGKIRGYLSSIARNLARQSTRGKVYEVLDEGETSTPVACGASSPLEGVLENEKRTQLHSAIREIPEASREPFVLFYLEERSIQRVAVDLDLSLSAVKQRLYRARESLKSSVAAQLASEVAACRPALAGIVISFILSQTQEAIAQVATASAQVAAQETSAQVAAQETSAQVAAQETSAQASEAAANSTLSAQTTVKGAGLLGSTWLGGTVLGIASTAGIVLALGVLAVTAYSQSKTKATAPTANHLEAETSVSPESSELADSSRSQPVLEEAEAVPPIYVEGESDQPLITGRLQLNVEGADSDGDGILSSEEVESVRISEDAKMLRLIEENWDEPAMIVKCETVGMGATGVYESGVSFDIGGLRESRKKDLVSGLDLTLSEWIASNVVTFSREGRICYNTKAEYKDRVRQIRVEAKGETLEWSVWARSEDGESVYIDPPKELAKELAALKSEEMAQELIEKWGIRISTSKNSVYFHAPDFAFFPPDLRRNLPEVERRDLKPHPKIQKMIDEHRQARLAKLSEEQSEDGLAVR